MEENRISVIAIENTTLCGADCIMCPRELFSFCYETIDFELFKKSVNEAAKVGVEFINLTGFGDSVLSTNFEQEIKFIKENYPTIKIGITSTCHLIKDQILDLICEYVDELQISMYGMKKETYEKIHRGSLVFEEVKSNIDVILSRKKRPHCILEFLVMEENKNELEEWLNYYEPIADRVDVWKLQNWAGYLPSECSTREFTGCFRIDSLNGMYIRADGSVTMCCVDYNRELILGNIKQEHLWDIIEGDKVKMMRKMNSDGSIIDYSICKYCDQIYSRDDALVYSSDKTMSVGKHSMQIDKDIYKKE